MEPNKITRLYANAAKNLSRSWLGAGAFMFAASQNLLGAAGAWDKETRAVGEVVVRAARRSGEETRAVSDTMNGAPHAASLARFGDLARAQAFLWSAAGLAAGERLGRAASEALSGFGELAVAFGWVPRAFVLGAVATDLWQGYAALRERARWASGLVRDEDWELQHRRGAGRVLDAAAALGGTLIKAAQFASSRPDLLPAAYTESLSVLQDRVPPQPWTAIAGAVVRELGHPVSEVFEEFDHTPIASASISQVHRARLRDGRMVAVKVQYPGIQSLITADLVALEGIFGGISRLEPSVWLQPILGYLRWTLPLELDFRREAGAIVDLKDALGHRDDVVIPNVVEELSTERLLIMEFVEGVKITDYSGLLAAGIEPGRVAELLVDVYAEQLFRHGIFHADPHPGNLFVQPGPEGPVLVILDHGLTVRVPPKLIEALKEAMEALYEGDFEALTAALQKAGLDLAPNLELETLLELVGVLLGGDRGDEVAGEEADGEKGDLGQFGLKLGASIGHIPNDLLLVGRALGIIDGINRQLAPELDVVEIVAQYAQDS